MGSNHVRFVKPHQTATNEAEFSSQRIVATEASRLFLFAFFLLTSFSSFPLFRNEISVLARFDIIPSTPVDICIVIILLARYDDAMQWQHPIKMFHWRE